MSRFLFIASAAIAALAFAPSPSSAQVRLQDLTRISPPDRSTPFRDFLPTPQRPGVPATPGFTPMGPTPGPAIIVVPTPGGGGFVGGSHNGHTGLYQQTPHGHGYTSHQGTYVGPNGGGVGGSMTTGPGGSVLGGGLGVTIPTR